MSLNKPITLLSQRSLKRLAFHWYWGLVMTTDNNQSLWTSIQRALKADEGMQRKMNVIDHIKNRWFAPLYWIFNINDYRSDSYLCGAYCSYLLFEEVCSRLDASHKQEALHQGYYRLSPEHAFTNLTTRNYMFSAVIYNPLQRILPGLTASVHSSAQEVEMIDFSTDEAVLFPEVGTQNAGEPGHEDVCSTLYKGVVDGATWVASFFCPAQDTLRLVGDDVQAAQEQQDDFKVNSHILARLKMLGINEQIKVGDMVTYAEFKKAYHNKLRATHPDKTFEATERDFRDVQLAYKYVLTQVDPNISEAEKYANFLNERQRLIGEIEEFIKISREQDEETEDLAKKTRELTEKFDEINEGALNFLNRIQEVDAKLEALERAQALETPPPSVHCH